MPAQPPVDTDDLELVARIMNSDEEAAEEFAHRYSGLFERLAKRSGIPPDDSRDVSQEALLDAYRQLRRGAFQGRSPLGTWVGKIIKGKIADYWRKQSRAIESTITPLAEADDDPCEDMIRKIPDPAISLNIRLDVFAALKKMETPYRVILLLNRTLGYTIEEISHMTQLTNGLTSGQIAGRLITAQNMFRRLLAEYEDGSAPSRIGALSRAMKGPEEPVVEGNDDGRPEQIRTELASRQNAGPNAGLRGFIAVLRTRIQRIAHGLLFRARESGRATTHARAYAQMRGLPARGGAIGGGGARA